MSLEFHGHSRGRRRSLEARGRNLGEVAVPSGSERPASGGEATYFEDRFLVDDLADYVHSGPLSISASRLRLAGTGTFGHMQRPDITTDPLGRATIGFQIGGHSDIGSVALDADQWIFASVFATSGSPSGVSWVLYVFDGANLGGPAQGVGDGTGHDVGPAIAPGAPGMPYGDEPVNHPGDWFGVQLYITIERRDDGNTYAGLWSYEPPVSGGEADLVWLSCPSDPAHAPDHPNFSWSTTAPGDTFDLWRIVTGLGEPSTPLVAGSANAEGFSKGRR